MPPTGNRRAADDLAACVREALTDRSVRGESLVVAVSGGADSTALLRLLVDLRGELDLRLTAAHLNHRLRPDSEADAAWIESLCAALEVPLRVSHAAPTDPQAVSEETARDWRRAFLLDVACENDAAWVATGHTQDDQAETVLQRLLRGTGPRGLAGIGVVAPLGSEVQLIRPLLDVSRAEVERWLGARGQSWRTDATNVDPRFTRNRIRHSLLPALRSDFNPQIDSALARLASQMRDLNDWLQLAARDALDTALLEQSETGVRLAISALAALPPLVRRELFVELWRRMSWSEQRMSAAHWEALVDLVADAGAVRRRQLPGEIDVQRDHGLLRLQQISANTAAPRNGTEDRE